MVGLNWASCYLKSLRCLTVLHNHCPGPGVIERLLRNNANTLVHLKLVACDKYYSLNQHGVVYPCLQTLRWYGWTGRSIIDFLPGCANLTELALFGNHAAHRPPLAATIVEGFPLLIKLVLNVSGVAGTDLLQIARGCSHIQYLEVSDGNLNDMWCSECAACNAHSGGWRRRQSNLAANS